MAKPSLRLISALRETAKNLANGANYQWGHMGSCNCGNLAQVLTPFTKAEIHKFAMEKSGDWSEQIQDYCPTSGYPMDMLIEELLKQGLTETDLQNLEYLSDKEILLKMGRYVDRNNRVDVIDYLKTWADLLEEKLIKPIGISGVWSHSRAAEMA